MRVCSFLVDYGRIMTARTRRLRLGAVSFMVTMLRLREKGLRLPVPFRRLWLARDPSFRLGPF